MSSGIGRDVGSAPNVGLLCDMTVALVEAFVCQIGGTLATAAGSGGTTFTVRLPASDSADET